MCLAVPVRVVALAGEELADVEIGGVLTRVSTALVEDVVVGDHLIVHAGFALTRLDVAAAEASLALFAEIARHLETPSDALRPRLP